MLSALRVEVIEAGICWLLSPEQLYNEILLSNAATLFFGIDTHTHVHRLYSVLPRGDHL